MANHSHGLHVDDRRVSARFPAGKECRREAKNLEPRKVLIKVQPKADYPRKQVIGFLLFVAKGIWFLRLLGMEKAQKVTLITNQARLG